MMLVKILFCVLFLSVTAYAQDMDFLSQAAGNFQDSLKSLKMSAEQLSMGNQVLASKNEELKIHMNKIQGRLQKILEENEQLTRLSMKLQDGQPTRAEKIAKMEKEIFELDGKIEHLQEDIKVGQAKVSRLYEEDKGLSSRIEELGLFGVSAVAEPPKPAVSPDGDHAKEKLRLYKMIYESKQNQEDLNRQVIATHKQKPFSVITVEKAGDKGSLLAQIKDLQDQIDQLNMPVMDIAAIEAQWVLNPQQLRQLEMQVNSLQKNADELESLSLRMRQKITKTVMSRDQVNEQSRLRGTLAELNSENKKLKVQFNDLRLKMVNLDKRETALESKR